MKLIDGLQALIVSFTMQSDIVWIQNNNKRERFQVIINYC